MIKAILFDLDGVLVHSFDAWFATVNQAASFFGNDYIKEKDFKTSYGESTEEDVRKFFPNQTVKSVDDFYENHFISNAKYLKVDPDAVHVFQKLKDIGLFIVVVTNTSHDLALDILSIANLKPDRIIGGGDVVKAKPAPEMIFKALNSLKVEVSETLFVGDSVYDQKAANSAGVTFIGIGGIDGDNKISCLSQLLDLVH